MLTIEDRFNGRKLDVLSDMKIINCPHCDSVIAYKNCDIKYGTLGIPFITCPCCGDNIDLENEEPMVLTRDNVRFPEHYYKFNNDDGVVKVTDERVDTYVRQCIDTFRNAASNDFNALRIGEGNTEVFVFRYDGDEEYVVYVGKNGYETNIPFEDVDYK